MPAQKIVCHTLNEDDDYRDVRVYIVDDDGSEWALTATLDKGSNNPHDGYWEYAEDQDDCFDEADTEPPPYILDAFNVVRDTVHGLLHSEGAIEWRLGREYVFRNVSGEWVEE